MKRAAANWRYRLRRGSPYEKPGNWQMAFSQRMPTEMRRAAKPVRVNFVHVGEPGGYGPAQPSEAPVSKSQKPLAHGSSIGALGEPEACETSASMPTTLVPSGAVNSHSAPLPYCQ